MLLLPNQTIVLNAFAALANAAPGKANYDYHASYVKDFGVAGYSSALNQIFAGVTDRDLAALILNNLGLGGVFTLDVAESYIAANAADRVGAVLSLANALYNYNGTETNLVAAKAAYVSKVEYSYNYSAVQANAAPSNFPSSYDGNTFYLKAGVETLIGSAANNVFKGITHDAFNNGDVLDGGVGNDTLDVILAINSYAVRAVTTSIETVKVSAQSTLSSAAGDNNIGNSDAVTVDAHQMQGVTKWENNNSRADLIIEDVRIADNEITKDITIAMVETDPGDVDFGVYFDQYSLRAGRTSTSTLALELLDTRSAAAGTSPLKDNPYWGFGFYLNGTAKVIASDAIDNAQTYVALRDAITARIAELVAAGDTSLAGVTVSLGADFNRYDTESGKLVTGTTVLLTDANGGKVTIDANTGWQTKNGVVPPSSGLHTKIEPFDPLVAVDLVTSKVILDDVGRGSNGGDLVIGGLSVGDTSNSKGVERFEIEVRDNSKLASIASTNNTLREVKIVNGLTSSHNITNAYSNVVTVENKGNLTVGNDVTGTGTELPDGENGNSDNNGFTDVRLIDGTEFVGKLSFQAAITSDSVAKYLNLVDTASNPSADNIAFVYSGGANDDSITVDVDSVVVASRGTLSGREDFSFTANGGAGNDAITVSVQNPGGSTAWYADQKANANLSINGGEGNDTIKTNGSGDYVINAGSGNDVVYTDNTGAATPATWVVSAVAPTLGDLQGVAANNVPVYLYNGELTVTFSGASVNAALGAAGGVTTGAAVANDNGFEVKVAIPTGDNLTVTQYQLNQAIKTAINSDAVLSKLLKAEDGPMNTLVVTSKVDGEFANTDIDLVVTSKVAAVADVSDAALTAYQKFAKDSTADKQDVVDAINTVVTGSLAVLNGRVNTALAAGGADGIAETDNTIELGAGNDLAVLSTSVLSSETLVFKGYDLGKDTVLNFVDSTSATATAIDKLDFTSYLTGKFSNSGSVNSQEAIAVTLNGNSGVEANSVTVLTGAFTTTDTFAGLTAARLLAAINSTNTGSANYAGIDAGDLDAVTTYTSSGVATTLVGGVGKAVVMVENDLNDGEYAVFELTFNGTTTNTTADFSAAQLIGVVDFGDAVTLTAPANLIGA